jgi:hypothetical protein
MGDSMPPLKSTFYGGFDACPINIEFPGDDRAIFRVGVFHSLAFHCKTLSMARQARKNTNAVENVKEIN